MANRAIPTALRVLRGNPGKRALPESEPKPQAIEPEMPQDLDPIAKKTWKRLAPTFVRLGILTEIDGLSFAELCMAEAHCIRIRKALKACSYRTLGIRHSFLEQESKDGSRTNEVMAVEAKINPLMRQYRSASDALRFWCQEFGATPSSRGRVKVQGIKEPDPQEAFLDGE